MRIDKRGLFYRIIVGDSMSKKKFWRRTTAIKYYYSHQDRHGFPSVERKGKWLK